MPTTPARITTPKKASPQMPKQTPKERVWIPINNKSSSNPISPWKSTAIIVGFREGQKLHLPSQKVEEVFPWEGVHD